MSHSVTNNEIKESEVKLITTKELMGEAQTLMIQHGSSCYQLRITKENKLILTK